MAQMPPTTSRLQAQSSQFLWAVVTTDLRSVAICLMTSFWADLFRACIRHQQTSTQCSRRLDLCEELCTIRGGTAQIHDRTNNWINGPNRRVVLRTCTLLLRSNMLTIVSTILYYINERKVYKTYFSSLTFYLQVSFCCLGETLTATFAFKGVSW